MKIFKASFAIVVLMLLCSINADAKNIFRHYDMSMGLSQNTVFAIAQDHTGFMWFGTKNGLNRFDSYSFRTYFEGKDEHSLKSDYINALCEGPDNRLWVGTDKGLFIYNPILDAFETLDKKTKEGKSIKGNINIIATVGNYIYINTQSQGIFRYDTKSKTLIYKDLGKYMAVTSITPDSKQQPMDRFLRIWIIFR